MFSGDSRMGWWLKLLEHFLADVASRWAVGVTGEEMDWRDRLSRLD